MSKFNFMKGRQMIIHDARLDNPHTDPPTQLKPPPAFNTWTVRRETPNHIIGWASTVAKGDSGKKKLDALHFMAHGSVGGMQLGSGRLGWQNYSLFQQLKGHVRAIVFFSCKVGGEQYNRSLSYELTFGNAVAKTANCQVLTCRVNQIYSWNKNRVIDFGAFEDAVYLYSPDKKDAQMLNYSRKSKVDLEKIIFG